MSHELSIAMLEFFQTGKASKNSLPYGMSVSQAASFTGISARSLEKLIAHGLIETYSPLKAISADKTNPNKRLIKTLDLIRYLENCTNKTSKIPMEVLK